MLASLTDILIRRLARRTASPAQGAAVPPGHCVYAIGDIHGEADQLSRMMARIGSHAAAARSEGDFTPIIVFLGDYVDRGPRSRAVLDQLVSLAADPCAIPGARFHFLKGNHEEAMMAFLDQPEANAAWLNFGGVETLASYGLRTSVGLSDPSRLRDLGRQMSERLPAEHLSFMRNLELMATIGDYAFVHAGIRPGIPMDQQNPADLLWIREPFLGSQRRHGKVIVHGHSIVQDIEFRHNRIAVDTGAYASGRLSCLVLQGEFRERLNSVAR